MEHGLKHFSFYVQKHIVTMGMCYNPTLVRDKPLGTPASVKLVYCPGMFQPEHPINETLGMMFNFKSNFSDFQN